MLRNDLRYLADRVPIDPVRKASLSFGPLGPRQEYLWKLPSSRLTLTGTTLDDIQSHSFQEARFLPSKDVMLQNEHFEDSELNPSATKASQTWPWRWVQIVPVLIG